MSIINITFGEDASADSEWNSVTSLASGSKVADLDDATGTATGTSLSFDLAFSFLGANGLVAPTHGYPTDACDQFFNGTSAVPRVVAFVFPSEHAGKTHTMTVWGATSSTGTARDGLYTVKDSGGATLATGEHDAQANGVEGPLSLVFTMPSDGVIDLNCVEAEVADIAFYLSVITITYNLGVALTDSMVGSLNRTLTHDLTG